MIYFIFAALIILIDRVIKIWISSALEIGQALEFIPGLLRIIHVENTGAAFSLFSDMRWPLVIVSSIASVVLIVILLRYRDGELGRLGASFMLGGAVGNLIDRIATGRVIDMFEPQFINFAVFNVADIFVTTGCLIFIGHLIHLMIVQGRKKDAVTPADIPEKPAPEKSDPPSEGAPADDKELTERQIMIEYYTEQGFDDRDS